MTAPEVMQTLHRGFAAATALYTFILTCLAFSKRWVPAIRMRLLLCLITVLLQIVAGVMVVLTTIDLPWAVLHLAIGTALFAFVSEARIYLGNLSVKKGLAVEWDNFEKNSFADKVGFFADKPARFADKV